MGGAGMHGRREAMRAEAMAISVRRAMSEHGRARDGVTDAVTDVSLRMGRRAVARPDDDAAGKARPLPRTGEGGGGRGDQKRGGRHAC
jgi:hypothetical protein